MKKILFLHDPLVRVSPALLSSLANLASADHSYVSVLLLGNLYIEKTMPVFD